jgi:hypothetical protein
MEQKKSVFEVLSSINVNDRVEKKKDLSYLSWAWAWSEVKTRFPSATYEIKETEFEETLGFMCHTDVTIEGETLSMWLPVMDSSNRAMKKVAYSYSTKYGDKSVDSATMFDINKTIMRCLVKNLAMFGMGIYIYAGEDLPQSEVEEIERKKVEDSKPKPLAIDSEDWDKVVVYIESNKANGFDKIRKQIERRYTLSDDVIAKIKGVIK